MVFLLWHWTNCDFFNRLCIHCHHVWDVFVLYGFAIFKLLMSFSVSALMVLRRGKSDLMSSHSPRRLSLTFHRVSDVRVSPLLKIAPVWSLASEYLTGIDIPVLLSAARGLMLLRPSSLRWRASLLD